ncbi:hypothetical protein ACM78Y_28425 [Pseudomonas aeruginosa]
MNKANECTCPSGDGSLVHPCPAHPAVEQACWDERKLSDLGNELHNLSCSIVHENEKLAEQIGGIARELWNWPQACAALAQPSPAQAEAEQPEIVAFRYRCTNAEGEPLPGWFYSDGAGTLGLREPLMAVSQHERIIGAMRAVVTQLRQHKSDYMDAGQETYWALQNEIREREAEIARLDGLVSGRTAERDAALARVAEMEKQEPVATVARVPGEDWNGLHFYRDLQGIPSGIKLYAAPVAQAQHSVPEGWVQSLPLKDHQPCKPNEDRANGYTIPIYSRPVLVEEALRKLRAVLCDPIGNVVIDGSDGDREEVQRALGMLAAAPGTEVPQAWLDVQAERRRQVTAEGWTPEHDAALARVAELERQEPVALANRGLHAFWVKWTEAAAGLYGPGIKLYAAPVVQAQQLHDLDKQCRDDVARALGLRPNQERGFAWSYLLASIKSCVKASEDSAQAQHSVPGDIMRDAQRYRWLRDQQFYFSFSTENSDAGISSCTAGMSSRFKNLSWVDAAIDSAIAAAPGKEGNDD